MSLRSYLGELFLVPYPLELSLIEPCDIGCVYCFANLGDRASEFKTSTKTIDSAKGRAKNGLKDILNAFINSDKRTSLEARLFNDRYPVLMSNRTDPFGRKNRLAAIAVLELFKEMGVPTAFQTKGFVKHEQDFDRVMGLIEPSHWYISITFLEDNDRVKEVEPGSMPIAYRWELVKELKRRGHVVSIGWNPWVPEWFGGLEGGYKFIQKMVDAGVDACAIQPLHLHQHWIMTDQEKQALHGGDMVWWDNIAGKKKPPAHWMPIFYELNKAAYDAGIPQIGHHFGWGHDLWGSTHKLYKKTYPTIADFAWHCKQTKQWGDRVTFREWYNWVMSWDVPQGNYGLGSGLALKSWRMVPRISEWMGWKNFHTKLSWETFLKISWAWQDKIQSYSPAAMPSFCPVVDKNQNLVLDDENLPILAWAPAPDHPMDYCIAIE